MSKYTTEVRYICEVKAGLNRNSGEYNPNKTYSRYDVVEFMGEIYKCKSSATGVFNPDDWWLMNPNKIVEDSIPTIFDDDIDVYEGVEKNNLFKKILLHYYTREICAETFGLWKLWLNNRMREIMPYYNQMYESVTYTYNPLINVDYSRTGNKLDVNNANEIKRRESNYKNDNSENGNSTNKRDAINNNEYERNGNETENNTGRNINRHSDTPQNGLTDVIENRYLTDADVIDKDENGNRINNEKGRNVAVDNENNENNYTRIANANGNENNEENNENNSTNAGNWEETIKGKMNGTSYSKLIMEYREAILNIDKMIIDELKDLFFYLW